MNAQHTQGRIVVNPIQLDQIATADASKGIARVTHFGHSVDTVIANARRLAACWNACEGISTDDLEKTGTIAAEVADEMQESLLKGMQAIEQLNAELGKVSDQRDELQEAVMAMLDREDNDCMPAGWSLDRVREIARKAIPANPFQGLLA